MRAVIGQHRMDRIGHGLDEGAEEVTGDASRGFLVQFDEGEFGDPVDGNQQIELALCGLDFGDVDVEVAKWVSFELAFGRDGAFDVRQSGDVVSLQAAVQRRSGEMRDGGL